MKKINTILIIFLFLLLFGCQAKETYLTQNIIKSIDNGCGKNNTCQIRMKDITDFKWDKMVVFQVGSSDVEVSKALGVEYKNSTDLISGLVFAYQGKIVHEERVPYDPEKPSKLNYIVKKQFEKPNSASFTPQNAIFRGTKETIDGVSYYSIIALSER